MITIHSERARKLITNPEYITEVNPSIMRKFPSENFNLWANLQLEGLVVKNLSFAGDLENHEKALYQAAVLMMKGKPYLLLEKLSLRECEAFLRDRNSVPAMENLAEDDAQKFQRVMLWLSQFPVPKEVKDYQFSLEKGPFYQLKLVDKIKELKEFLSSSEVMRLYTNRLPPSLVDVDDLTVYVQVPYTSDEDKAVFEDLHLLGVTMYQEESLNFIPEI